MIGLVFVWTVGFSLSTIFQCYPFSANWSPEGGGNVPGQCIDVNRMLMATAWSDVVTNVIIILLPLGCVGFLRVCFFQHGLHIDRYGSSRCHSGKKSVCTACFFSGLCKSTSRCKGFELTIYRTVGFGIAKLVVYYRVFGGKYYGRPGDELCTKIWIRTQQRL